MKGKCQRADNSNASRVKSYRFLGVGRFEHGHGRGHGKTAVVLFVLARRHARIVGRNDQQRSARARVGRGKKRIGGHVQADVLHGDQGRRASHGHAQSDLQGHLFVGSPLRHGRHSPRSVRGSPSRACPDTPCRAQRRNRKRPGPPPRSRSTIIAWSPSSRFAHSTTPPRHEGRWGKLQISTLCREIPDLAKAGSAKNNQPWLAPDFDAPSEDFRE